MTGILKLIQIILCASSFILLCVASLKVNLDRTERSRQVWMPLIAFVYCLLAMKHLNDLYYIVLQFFQKLVNVIPVLANIQLTKYAIYLVNFLLAVGFLVVKLLSLAVLKRVSTKKPWMEYVIGRWYEYDKELDKWFLKQESGQKKYYGKGIYIAAVIASSLIFILSRFYPEMSFFQSAFYPVFGIIVLGEVLCFLSGLMKSEFIEDILGEDEESYKVSNYGLLRDILKKYFGGRVLHDATVDNGIGMPVTYETLEEMCESEDGAIANLGIYFRAKKESGCSIEPSYVKSCAKMMQGHSVLFCNPFYRDLTDYLILPMTRQLMKNRKTLVVMGRDSATDDVLDWLREGIVEQIHTDSLWKVDILGSQETEADIAILKFCDLFDFEIQKKNEAFLQRVGFVFIVEPSKLLATGQIGLNLLVGRFQKEIEVVYAACDRNCDGLVDALSHTLRTNITEVAATSPSSSVTSMMCWAAEGPYMHHKIFSNISRYLGVGTEINAVALKYQIASTKWISGEKFPVLDLKWIAGQYYQKICAYTDLPVSQESFNKAFQVDSNLWGQKKDKNAFLVVEDEFQNIFEMIRLYATRAKEQSFINVISENYLLRDYMFENANTFMADPKAIPTIVADYARTERNAVLKLLMRMSSERVSEEEIADTLMLSGIAFDSEAPIETLKELVSKHCDLDEFNVCVFFKDELLEDGFRTSSKKYYRIEEKTRMSEFARNLNNAYYIAEDEKGDTYYIGAKLYGHVFQALIPGQFLTYDGKYYEVQSITPQNGVVLRRAADHITNRKYYRQMRQLTVENWKDDTSVGGQKILGNIRIQKGYCDVSVQTDGYVELNDYHDLKSGRCVYVNNIPTRSYRNKLVMKVELPGATEKMRYTIALLMNEIFRTTYPDAFPYICAVTQVSNVPSLEGALKYAMYCMDGMENDEGIYIVEDSEIDLGLIVSVERNLERYFGMITEFLNWHDMKMHEIPEQEQEEEEFVPEFTQVKECTEEKKKGFFRRLWEKIKSFFKKKPKQVAEEEEQVAEEPEQEEQVAEESEQEEQASEESVQDTKEEVADDAMPDEQTTYQKHCFLKYGYEEFASILDLEGTALYLGELGYDHNPLQQVRDQEKMAEEYAQQYDPNKTGVHFCDFCGVELAGGEYEILKDGRERCNHCSATALRTGEEFKEVFKMVLCNMEVFFGIKINASIRVRMTDAQTIAKHVGMKFVATPGADGRVLGFAKKDASGYSLYIENGSPKLAAMATIAHELTHIWQYQNWDEKAIVSAYGAQNRLEVYEGMAKWVEIQYLFYLNELEYGKREQIRTMMRQDEYGRGFLNYLRKYSLSYSQEKKRTPFQEFPPL